MKIENIKVSDYLNGINKQQIDYALRYGKFEPLDAFNIGDLMSKNFGFVKDVQHLLSKSVELKEYISFLNENGHDMKEINLKGIIIVYQSYLYLIDQINKINKLEADNLSHISSSEEEAAGIDRFSKYGVDLQYTSLAGSDDYEAKERVKNWPYTYCFMVLLKQKDSREFEEDLFKIRNRKK